MTDAQSLVTVDQLDARLTIADTLQAEAAGALEDLSEDARFYGSDNWVNPASTPQPVIKLILRAAVRHMKNVDGLIESRAGDETVQWNKEAEQFLTPGTASFTGEEKARLREYGGGASDTGLWSVDTYATPGRQRRRPRTRFAHGAQGPTPIAYEDYRGCNDEDFAPVEGGGPDFPLGGPDW